MALGKKNKTDGVEAEDQLTLPEEEDLQQLDPDDEHLLPSGEEPSDGDTKGGTCEHKERGIHEATQDGTDCNDNRTQAQKGSHELLKEEKKEEGDEVDGEKKRGRRQSLLEQMVARSLNIDPQHPSQPPILGSKPDPANSEEEEEKKGEEDSGNTRRQRSSLGGSFLASIASLRSQPVTPGLKFCKKKSGTNLTIPNKSPIHVYSLSSLSRSLVQG